MAYRHKSPTYRAELRNGDIIDAIWRRHLKPDMGASRPESGFPHASSLGFVPRDRIEGISTDIGITLDGRDAATQKCRDECLAKTQEIR
jgi:hypothetical protein